MLFFSATQGNPKLLNGLFLIVWRHFLLSGYILVCQAYTCQFIYVYCFFLLDSIAFWIKVAYSVSTFEMLMLSSCAQSIWKPLQSLMQTWKNKDTLPCVFTGARFPRFIYWWRFEMEYSICILNIRRPFHNMKSTRLYQLYYVSHHQKFTPKCHHSWRYI